MTQAQEPFETEREGTAPGQFQPGTEHQPSGEQEAPHEPNTGESHAPFGGSPEEVAEEEAAGEPHE